MGITYIHITINDWHELTDLITTPAKHPAPWRQRWYTLTSRPFRSVLNRWQCCFQNIEFLTLELTCCFFNCSSHEKVALFHRRRQKSLWVDYSKTILDSTCSITEYHSSLQLTKVVYQMLWDRNRHSEDVTSRTLRCFHFNAFPCFTLHSYRNSPLTFLILFIEHFTGVVVLRRPVISNFYDILLQEKLHNFRCCSRTVTAQLNSASPELK